MIRRIASWGSRFSSYFSGNEAYDSASIVKGENRKWFKPLYAPNDELSKANRMTILSRVQDLQRNDCTAESIIERFVTEIVGIGLTPDHTPEAMILEKDFGYTPDQIREKSREIERKFKFWCKSRVDTAEEMNLYLLQRLAYRTQKAHGDVFVNTVIRRGKLLLQLIEPERVSNNTDQLNTPTMIDGLELDNRGRVIAVWVQVDHPGNMEMQSTEPYQWKRYPTYDRTGRLRIFQVVEHKRANRRRGASILVVTLNGIKQLNRYARAELYAAVVSANPALFIKTPYETGPMQKDEDEQGNPVIHSTPGAINELAPGEEIVSPTPGRPNPQFESFDFAQLKKIAASVKLPVEILLMHFSASFSASRAAFLMFKKVVDEERMMFSNQFNDRIAEIWLDNEVAQGRIEIDDYMMTREYWNKFKWTGAAIGSIKELEQLNAAEKRLNLNLSTEAEEAALLGKDWDDLQQRLEVERRERGDGDTGTARPQPTPTDRL